MPLYCVHIRMIMHTNTVTVSSFDNFMVRDHMSVWLNDTDD